MQVSDQLNQPRFVERMKEFLQTENHNILRDFDDRKFSSLDILGAMVQACLISSNDLSQLRRMVELISRIDLAQQIDEFNKNNGVYKKGKFVDYLW